MLRLSLCDYSNAYLLLSGTLTIAGARNYDAVKRLDEKNKGIIFKNCAPSTDCISPTNNTQIDNARQIDVVILMYNLIEYSDNYSKSSKSLRQSYRDDPNDNITDSKSFKYKIKIRGKILLMVIQRMLKQQRH